MKIITSASAVIKAHRALIHRETVGLLADEQDLLHAVSDGTAYLRNLDEVAAFFGVKQPALVRWREWDGDGVLTAGGPYQIRAIEAIRERMLRTCERVRLRDSDQWPSLRRRHGFGG